MNDEGDGCAEDEEKDQHARTSEGEMTSFSGKP
jgi:hypothetical protein